VPCGHERKSARAAGRNSGLPGADTTPQLQLPSVSPSRNNWSRGFFRDTALLADFLPHWLVMTGGSVFVLFSVFASALASGDISCPDRRLPYPMRAARY
jgi:hypothetical protein